MQKCTAGAAARHRGPFFIQLNTVISPVPYGPHMEHLEHLQSELIKASLRGDAEGFWNQCHIEPNNQRRVLTVRLEKSQLPSSHIYALIQITLIVSVSFMSAGMFSDASTRGRLSESTKQGKEETKVSVTLS